MERARNNKAMKLKEAAENARKTIKQNNMIDSKKIKSKNQ